MVNLIGILHESRRRRFDEVQGALPGRIARAAADAGIERMVQLSAIGADPGSASAYARSKAEGERRVREALPSAVIVRPSIVIGPEDSFFNRFAEMARLLPALPLIGGGKTLFQPVYVGDVAEAIVAGLQRADMRRPDLRAGRSAGLQLRRADALHAGRARPAPAAAAGLVPDGRRCRRASSSCCRRRP